MVGRPVAYGGGGGATLMAERPGLAQRDAGLFYRFLWTSFGLLAALSFTIPTLAFPYSNSVAVISYATPTELNRTRSFPAIIAIVLGSSAAVGGLGLIGWYCWKHHQHEKTAVQPKPSKPG